MMAASRLLIADESFAESERHSALLPGVCGASR